MGQFFTGMTSRGARCAKPDGVNATTAIKPAPRRIFKISKEYEESGKRMIMLGGSDSKRRLFSNTTTLFCSTSGNALECMLPSWTAIVCPLRFAVRRGVRRDVPRHPVRRISPVPEGGWQPSTAAARRIRSYPYREARPHRKTRSSSRRRSVLRSAPPPLDPGFADCLTSCRNRPPIPAAPPAGNVRGAAKR